MPKQTFFNLSDKKRNHITECALEEFCQYGYDGANISRIVRTAGIAKGSFYQYFEDKEDLYVYLISHLIADRKLEMARERFSAEIVGDKPLFEILRSLFDMQINAFLYDPKLMKLSVDFLQNPNSAISKRISTKYSDITADYFTSVLEHARNRGELDPKVDLKTLNFLIVSMSYQTIHYVDTQGTGVLSRELFMDMLDKLEYILTNGIFRKEGVERRHGA